MNDSAAGVAIPDDLVQVGHVSGAYGIVGGIRVTPYSTDADALLNVKTWWIDKPALRAVTVRSAKLHGGDVVATLVDMRDRDEAEALKGATVQVARSEFPQLEEDEYYWSDLIGLDVVNLQGVALQVDHVQADQVGAARSEFPQLEEDEYYWSDLIGLDVVNLQGEALGKVTDMMHNGAQSILRIAPVADPASETKAPERLVPFVDHFVKTVSLDKKLITLDWGLDF